MIFWENKKMIRDKYIKNNNEKKIRIIKNICSKEIKIKKI